MVYPCVVWLFYDPDPPPILDGLGAGVVVAAQVGRVVNAVVGDVVSSSRDHDGTAGSSPVVLLMFGLVALLSFVSSPPPSGVLINGGGGSAGRKGGDNGPQIGDAGGISGGLRISKSTHVFFDRRHGLLLHCGNVRRLGSSLRCRSRRYHRCDVGGSGRRFRRHRGKEQPQKQRVREKGSKIHGCVILQCY